MDNSSKDKHVYSTVRDALATLPRREGLVDPASARQVVAILSSSRGGSSLLFHQLRASGAFLSLPGEHSHLYKLYGLGLPAGSDAHDGDVSLDADHDGFTEHVFRDCSVTDATDLDRPVEYVGDVVTRLLGQWPGLAGHVQQVWDLAQEALPPRERWRAFDGAGYVLDLIGLLRAVGHPIDPWFYDLPPARIRARFPDLPRPVGPPPGVPSIIEEPPFVVPRPVVRPAHDDTRPLLLKASVDAYRADLLPKLFPQAEIQIVHLVRNPAAAINGLYDGWLDRGFYSHNVQGRASLAIDGYSHLPWGRSRWNFDLPPGWRGVVESPLATVCALQWRKAHQHILDATVDWPGQVLRVRAEELMAGGDRRHAALANVLALAGADTSHRPPATDTPVMTTMPPAPGRWRKRSVELAPVLAMPETVATAVALGYGAAPDSRWT